MIKYAVFDFDFVAFAAASVAEERSIIARHPSGIEEKFSTRTDFWGTKRNHSGGWLAKYNSDKSTPLLPEEWIIEDVQTPQAFSAAGNAANTQIESILAKLGLNRRSTYGWVGKGESWRVNASSILKYKSNREGMLRPIHLTATKEFLIRRWNAEWQEHLEVDDRVVMECYKDPERVLVAIDKDALGTACNVFSPYKMDFPQDCDCFGKLYIDDKGEVRGYGRKWWYFQVASSDGADFYAANSASDVKWGQKSAYSELVGCKTDKEAWQQLVNIYQHLYPSPVQWDSWNKGQIEVDWLYAFQENVTMSHMLRWDGDYVDVRSVLDKLKVQY